MRTKTMLLLLLLLLLALQLLLALVLNGAPLAPLALELGLVSPHLDCVRSR